MLMPIFCLAFPGPWRQEHPISGFSWLWRLLWAAKTLCGLCSAWDSVVARRNGSRWRWFAWSVAPQPKSVQPARKLARATPTRPWPCLRAVQRVVLLRRKRGSAAGPPARPHSRKQMKRSSRKKMRWPRETLPCSTSCWRGRDAG